MDWLDIVIIGACGALIVELAKQLAKFVAGCIGRYRLSKIEKQKAIEKAKQQEKWRRRCLFFRNMEQTKFL